MICKLCPLCAATVSFCFFIIAGMSVPGFAAENVLNIKEEPGKFTLLRDNVGLFTYVWEDPEILRPYFCNVRLYDGTRITRPYPTDAKMNKGNDDHATFHPGIWVAFGDVNGLDFWRNKARIRVTQAPKPELRSLGHTGYMLRFEDDFVLESPNAGAEPFAQGQNSFTVSFHRGAYVISWCLTMEPLGSEPLVFGDQEEMGLGLRMNTPLTVEFGNGRITNSEGQENESGTWGQEAAWCTYSAKVDDSQVGITVFSETPCWWHTRDYGLMVANAYGKKAMRGADDAEVSPMRTVIPPGKRLKRAYAICIFGLEEGEQNPEAVLKNLHDSLFTCDSE